jgi:opacity protein-like surface antigen
MKLMTTLTCSALLCSSAFASDKLYLETLSVKGGLSFGDSSMSHINGGVVDMNKPDDNGHITSLTAVLANKSDQLLKPYIDFARIQYDDRRFSTAGLGVRHDFPIDDGIELFLSGGVGYYFSHWSDSPAPATATGMSGSESLGTNLQAGMNWYFTDNLALDVSLRYDMYNQNTLVVENSSTTTISDTASLSTLVGLVYRFGTSSTKRVTHGDKDGDGITDAYDRCPNTLSNVPVNENGCPLNSFAFHLDYEFGQFELSHLVNQPQFEVVNFLNKHPSYHVRITGHTDNTGDDKFNQNLSLKRAQQGSKFLLENGIAEYRIKVAGKGASDPIASNLDTEGRAMNRRISVEFYKVLMAGKAQ